MHDYVIHSDHQWTAFGRHDLSGLEGSEHCIMASPGIDGSFRIRVIKGVQKAEGTWARLKHRNGGIPKDLFQQLLM